jgi:hypothetical protein
MVEDMSENVTGKEMRDKMVQRHLQGEYILTRPNWHRHTLRRSRGDGKGMGRAQRAGRLNDPCHHPHTDNTCLCPPPIFHSQYLYREDKVLCIRNAFTYMSVCKGALCLRPAKDHRST